jgi:Ribosomal protein L4/L1 family
MTLGALRSALSVKLAESKLTVVDGWTLETHKTKPFRQALEKLDKERKTVLLVESGGNLNLERASRNLEGVTLVASTALGPYDLMRHDHLMLSREAAVKLSRALSVEKTGEASEAAPTKGLGREAVEASTLEPAAQAASQRAKKPTAKTEKPKAKPKAKKG